MRTSQNWLRTKGLSNKVASTAPYSPEFAAAPAYAAKADAMPTVRAASWRAVVDDDFIAQWDRLATAASEPNPFSESWYLVPALQQFDPTGAVALFTTWQGDELVGLTPFGQQTNYGRWPLPNVQNWLHPNAFLGTPLVRTGHEAAFWQLLLDAIDKNPGHALFAHFSGLSADGALANALMASGRKTALVHLEERALLAGDLTPEAYIEAAVRGKKRKELRRQKNRLAELGELSFTRHGDDNVLGQWIDEFLTLERSGWKGGNGSALDCADSTRNLFRQALTGAAAQGKLERLDLRLDGKPLAMLVNFICSPGSFSFKTAFDEEYARFSPGVLLQIENLDLLNRSDIIWCDSCAAEGHPMIDSLWTGRRRIGRYSVAIGGTVRRILFGGLLKAERARAAARKPISKSQDATGDDE